MSYLIDTNVLSEIFKDKPNTQVIEWFKAVPSESLYISVLTFGEIRKGIEKLNPSSKKRNELILWLEHQLPSWFGNRVLSVSQEVCDRWGYLSAHFRTLPAIDGLLASTALTHNLKLVTRNVKDFEQLDLEIINPFI